jgi:hypothetical protein
MELDGLVMTHSPAGGCYVILHVGNAPSRGMERHHSPLVVQDGSTPFKLDDDIWIERLDAQLAIRIQEACEPRHYNFTSNSIPYNKHIYAFVRRIPGVDGGKNEAVTQLMATVALSRLIHPTSTGDRYCASVFHLGSEDSPIQAIQKRGVCPDVFPGGKNQDWLSVEDAEALRRLMPWLSKNKTMHRRVHRAFWNHEYAMRSYYLDVRWIFAVSGLEALTSVGKDNLARQFCDRVRRLAVKFKIDLTVDDLQRAYTLRSKLVHAENFLFGLETVLPQTQHTDLYEKVESVLRATVRHCLLDESFGDFFRDDAAVKARWPLSPKPKK